MSVTRPSGRRVDEMRSIEMIPGFAKHAEGSCFVKFGDTHVLVTASFEDKAPSWLRDTGKGWITAEYGMLPRSTHSRMRREVTSGKQSGRTQEIQRLIGRSMRAVVDLSKMNEKQIRIDCDVIQADGGTRTASISGAYVALYQCFEWAYNEGYLNSIPFTDTIQAISCGIYEGAAVLDLDYPEDSAAETDANFVLTGKGGIVEIQSTAEEEPFSEEEFLRLMRLARIGCQSIEKAQLKAIGK
ncbi:ribonuclease PH [Temperatibacter marinus]|uniref:Ribonuclease PH n=1 Tax=Temperatibacter marinus TaxID=1456591 RepID=A0AA52HBD4_9PROT|nr:ribonuclease PH [Temperatibacter marinus]WND03650.1 ribonuclease PH [Temperatibacter marinus]